MARTNGAIGWYSIWNVKDGHAEDFRTAVKELCADLEASEPGTFIYEWFVSEDGSTAYCHEFFDDEGAALAHLNGNGPAIHAPRLLQHSDLAALHILGDVNDEVRTALVPWNPTSFNPYLPVGFTRR